MDATSDIKAVVDEKTPFVPISYTVRGAARSTGETETQIYSAVQSGVLPARKAGRRHIIMHGDLVQHIASLPSVGGPVAA